MRLLGKKRKPCRKLILDCLLKGKNTRDDVPLKGREL